MKLNQLGNSELFVSEIGLGTMTLGTDKLKAQNIIDNAIDNGINFFDTADIYDNGLNEEIVGQSIKSKRHQVILATKVGNVQDSLEKKFKWDASKKHIHQAIRDSLKRLGTDYIDLYQLHGGMIEDNIPETIEAFEELKTDGLIRSYGISSIRPNVIHEYIKQSNISTNMMSYSLLDRRPEEFFPLFEENNVSLIARGTLAKGILTPAKKINSNVQENGYLSYSYAELQQVLEQIEKNNSLEIAALKFTSHHKVMGSTLIGASSVEQLLQNVKAMNEELSEEDYNLLKAITKVELYHQHR